MSRKSEPNTTGLTQSHKADRVKLIGLIVSTQPTSFGEVQQCLYSGGRGFYNLSLLLDSVNIAIESILITIKYVLKGEVDDFNNDASDTGEDETDGASDHEESAVLYFSMLYYVDFVVSLLKLD